MTTENFEDEKIPSNTPYCYETKENGERELCPYWNRIQNHNENFDGPKFYCEYTGKEDLIELGDQVKICGVNEGYD